MTTKEALIIGLFKTVGVPIGETVDTFGSKSQVEREFVVLTHGQPSQLNDLIKMTMIKDFIFESFFIFDLNFNEFTLLMKTIS